MLHTLGLKITQQSDSTSLPVHISTALCTEGLMLHTLGLKITQL